MNSYSQLRNLAKSIRYQNLFVASKEIFGIKIFRNSFDFSNIQNLFLSYLYSYEGLNKDIILEKISKHIFDSEIYEDAYILWKSKNIKKIDIKDNQQKELSLIPGRTINFPKKEKNG